MTESRRICDEVTFPSILQYMTLCSLQKRSLFSLEGCEMEQFDAMLFKLEDSKVAEGLYGCF